ncbi:MAG: hypothetical protein QME94_07720, partial [Anaerolineae bacterium]|nr:hypothetical protein [Anaerolineae bacterium]
MVTAQNAAAEASREDRRRAYLAQLRRVLPPSEPWEAWLAQSGELPPDFSAMPSFPDLPDPLVRTSNGRPVTTADEWRARREELKALFQQWLFGRMPPPPDNLRAAVVGERRGHGAIARQVELTFGPGEGARLRLELLIPEAKGPFPVFLTQGTHRSWAMLALRRGYLACVYAACDGLDDSDSFVAAYPGYDWSRLARRAWAASRCIDYLSTVPEADGQRIALTGHSRNGKQSLIASAFDERIAVVISSSSGAGGCLAARYASEQHFAEGIELITRVFPDWFHPRWRFFVGREDRLPVDLHELVALSAPRACLLSTALNDVVESTWAVQQTYLQALPVYRLLGAEGRLCILWRPGGHETWPAVIEQYLDWCDLHFGRGGRPFAERLLHPWDWGEWRSRTGERLPKRGVARRGQSLAGSARSVAEWEERRDEVRAQVRWMLGEAPPEVSIPPAQYGEEPFHVAALLCRHSPGDGLQKQQCVFGGYINGDLYLPSGLEASGRAPGVLWLHPFSFPLGYVGAYLRGEQVFRTLARAGFAVFCFDQIGCGRRIEEVEGFYQREPHGSILGRMVQDAGAALGAMRELPCIDPQRLWAAGYGLGALVGLHLAAIDQRLAGLVAVCGPQPFREDARGP